MPTTETILNFMQPQEKKPIDKRMDLYLKLILNGKPFSLFDDPAFQEITSKENKQLNLNLNSKVMKDYLCQTYEKTKGEIVNRLKGQYLCLKFDCASRSYRQFLSIKAQFIESGKIQNICIDFLELFEKHTAENLSKTIKDILSDYQITSRQIIAATTDTASNMIATTRKLSEKLADEDEQEAFFCSIEDQNTEEDLANNLTIALCQEIGHVKCGSHVIQLCVVDFLKNNLPIIEKARSVVKFLRKPTNMNAIRLQGMNFPPLDTVTR